MKRFYLLFLLGFIILNSLSISGLKACELDFTHTAIDNYGQIQFNVQSEFTTAPVFYEWSFGDGYHTNQANPVHTYSSSGTYPVCLTMEDANYCIELVCYDVVVTNLNSDDCIINDCVLPGDTDGNGVANIYDIYSIGMHYGEYGPNRIGGDGTWVQQPAQDWPVLCLNGNLKHTDCNGDGLINEQDLTVIESNYYNDHSTYYPPVNTPNAPTLSLEFAADSIFIPENEPGFINVSLDINIGTPSTPIPDIYALAFSIDFSDDIVHPGSVSVDYDYNSFFCDSENLLSISKMTNDGMLDIALSRRNQSPISGFGRIATVNFTIIGDIIINRTPEENETPFSIQTYGTTGIDNFGNNIGISTTGDFINLKIDDISNLKGNIDNNLFSISPNPSTGLFQLDFGTYTAEEYKVYDVSGKLLSHGSLDNASQQELDLSHLPNGTYMVKVSNKDSVATKRVVIAK